MAKGRRATPRAKHRNFHVHEGARVAGLYGRIRAAGQYAAGQHHRAGGVGLPFVVAVGFVQGLEAVVPNALDERNDREIVFLVGVDPRVGHGQKYLIAADTRNVVRVY